MKKPLDAATIVNELRGQSAFFPTKDAKPVPEQSGEPTEKKAFARLPAHQQTEKEAEQHVSNSANIQTSNHTSLQDSIDASNQTRYH